jgi:hypothetical protein
MSAPVFVVVGHPNKGKSSIVSTLAHDDTVVVAPRPGTTIAARSFPMRVDDEVLYTLVDTPGFQRARRALEWLQQEESTAADHPALVARFVREHRDGGDFRDEVELLTPIVQGGGILYVVDGSKPYGPEYEAEMEILRWTGRPSMGLINPIGSPRYVDEWEAALGQYFRIVRVLDAVQARFDQRVDLLRAFGQMREEWRAPMDRAVEVLLRDRRRRRRAAATVIADMLLEMMTLNVGRNLTAHEDAEPYRGSLEAKYKDRLRDLERDARRAVERAYDHHDLSRRETSDAIERDLFSPETWHLFGQSKWRLAVLGASSGAVAGGIVDASLAGIGFGVFTGLGAVAGGAVGWQAAEWSSSVRVFQLPGMERVGLAGKRVQVGPTSNRNLPYVALGRARYHHALVEGRTHAQREELVVDHENEKAGTLNRFPDNVDKRLEKIFHRIRRADGRYDRAVGQRPELIEIVDELLESDPTASSR